MTGDVAYFRKRFIGGFNRDDVVAYIAKITTERNEAIEAKEKFEAELENLSTHTGSPDKNTEEAESKVEELRRQIIEFCSQMQQMESETEELRSQIQQAEREASELRRQMQQSENEAEKLRSQNSELQEQIDMCRCKEHSNNFPEMEPESEYEPDPEYEPEPEPKPETEPAEQEHAKEKPPGSVLRVKLSKRLK